MIKERTIEQEVKLEAPKRVKLTEEETLRRTASFNERKEEFIASIRKSKD